jgi:hypothetical protein
MRAKKDGQTDNEDRKAHGYAYNVLSPSGSPQ